MTRPSLRWEPCDGADVGGVTSRCARYYPHAGGQYSPVYIRVAVLTPAQTPAHASPVVYMSGGPGEGGNTLGIKLERWRYWLIDNPIKRPLIVWDSRGNHGAWGHFYCEAYRLWALNQLLQHPDATAETAELDKLSACVARWRARIAPEPLAGLSSEQNARDVLGLLKALNVSHWHVLSVSYGSRVAEWLAALAPTQTQSLLLDSPYSWQVRTSQQRDQFWWQAFERFFDYCDRKACIQDEPMATVFARAMARLDQQALSVPFTLDGYRYVATVDAVTFAHLVYHRLYQPSTYPQAAQLLWAVAQAAVGPQAGQPKTVLPRDNASLQALLADYVAPSVAQSYSAAANPWLYWVTECNDNDWSLPAHNKRAQREVEDVKATLPHSTLTVTQPVLPRWQRFLQPINHGAHRFVCQLATASIPARPPPVPSQPQALPVLVLSAVLDPVTPTQSALALAHRYGGVMLQTATAGHGVLLSEGCSRLRVVDYWQNPRAHLNALSPQVNPVLNRPAPAMAIKPDVANLGKLVPCEVAIQKSDR